MLSGTIWKATGSVLGFQLRNLLINCVGEETVIEKPQLGDCVRMYLDKFPGREWGENTKGKDFGFFLSSVKQHI